MVNILPMKGSDDQTRYVNQQELGEFVKQIGGNPEDGRLTVEQDKAVRAFVDKHTPQGEIAARASSEQ